MFKALNQISLFIGLFIAVSGCSGGDADPMNKTIKIRGQLYHIPARYILSDLPWTMVPRGPDMDTDEGINLEIPLSDIGVTPLPHMTKNGMAGTVIILLHGPDAYINQNEYGISPDAYYAWKKLEHYRHQRIIERDDKIGLYRIYWRSGAKSWEYFVAPPSKHGDVSSPKWVAGCRSRFHEPEAEDMSNVICRTKLSTKQGDVDISFTGRYVTEIEKIKHGLHNLIKQWVAGQEN